MLRMEEARRQVLAEGQVVPEFEPLRTVRNLLVPLPDQHRRTPACLAGGAGERQPLPDLRRMRGKVPAGCAALRAYQCV